MLPILREAATVNTLVESKSYRVEHGPNESASLLNSFPFEKRTHACSHWANPALVDYNPGRASHSNVISLLENLLVSHNTHVFCSICDVTAL